MRKYEHPSVDEVLEMAARAEQTMKDLSIFDPAYGHFLKDRDFFLNMAIEMEEAKKDHKNV